MCAASSVLSLSCLVCVRASTKHAREHVGTRAEASGKAGDVQLAEGAFRAIEPRNYTIEEVRFVGVRAYVCVRRVPLLHLTLLHLTHMYLQ